MTLEGVSRVGYSLAAWVTMATMLRITRISPMNMPMLDFLASSLFLAEANRWSMFWSPSIRAREGRK